MRKIEVYDQDVQKALRHFVRCDSPDQKSAAHSLGVSPQYLSDVLAGRRPIADRLAATLGYRKAILWVCSGEDDSE